MQTTPKIINYKFEFIYINKMSPMIRRTSSGKFINKIFPPALLSLPNKVHLTPIRKSSSIICRSIYEIIESNSN